MFSVLQDNVRAARGILQGVDTMEILSHPVSPIIHLAIKAPSSTSLSPSTATASHKPSNPSHLVIRDAPVYDTVKEDGLLQEVVDAALLQGVLITRAKRLYGESEGKVVSWAYDAENWCSSSYSLLVRNGASLARPFDSP